MEIKRTISLIILAALLGFFVSLLVNVQTWAQISNAGFSVDGFTFFIPFPTEILDDQFDAGHAALDLVGADIETTISIAVHRSNTIIFYDHWEDGLEPILTSPIQPTTQIWGDNNPANGIPPGFLTDTLNSGDVLILQNLVELNDAGYRDSSMLFFDGGDILTSLGGPLAVTLAVWPDGPGILYAGAWPLYPTNRWGTDFRLPVGTDLATERPAFVVVGLNVQAFQDETAVQLDLDADGNFEELVVLNRGEQFTSLNGINVGARVQTSLPVQVHILTANPASTYEARAYTIVPFDQWGDDLMAPRSSDGDYWLYNPHDTSMQVRVQTVTATTVITLPANWTIKYPPVGLSGPTGIRFTSLDNRSFYGLAALDEADEQDWGYALSSIDRLDTQVLIGLGIGNNTPPPDGPDGDESRVYVTAASTTTIFVDFDNDGTPDDNFPVSPLAEVPITDPDHDLTGAFLFTNNDTPFMAVWGQDASANPALPSIDVGTSIISLPSLLIQKTVDFLVTDADCTGTITPGDIVQFRLYYFNNSFRRIADVNIQDSLPDSVTYVRNSTVLNGEAIPDIIAANPFPLSGEGYSLGTLDEQDSGYVTFDVIINNNANEIINRASISSGGLLLEEDYAEVFAATQETAPILKVDKMLIDPSDGVITTGQIITFSLLITNTSPITITTLPIQDTFDEGILTFQYANPAPDDNVSGVVSWRDLTNSFGDLYPGSTISVNIAFLFNGLPNYLESFENHLTVLEALRSDDLPPLICNANVVVVPIPMAGETPVPTSTPTPTPTVTPEPPATSTEDVAHTTMVTPEAIVDLGTAPDVDASVLPVLFLPETGVSPPSFRGDVVLYLCLVGLVAVSLWFGAKHKK